MGKEVSHTFTLPVSVALAWDVWADLPRYPEWMDHLERIEVTGKRTSRWTMRRGDGGTAGWDTEITVYRPEEELAWSSFGGDLVTYGRVRFEALGPRRTRLTVTRFHAVGRRQDPALLAARFGEPEEKLRADLKGYVRQLKRVLGKGRAPAAGAADAPRPGPPPGGAT